MNTMPTLQIPADVIEPIINAHVSAALLQAIGGHKAIVEQTIASILSARVDSEGKATGSTYNTQPFIDWAVGNVVRNAVRGILEHELKKHEDLIRKQLTAELGKKNSPFVRQLVEGMTKQIVDAASNKWQLTVECK